MCEFSLSFRGYEGDLERRQKEVRSKFLELIHFDRTPKGRLRQEAVEETEVAGLPALRHMVSRGSWDPQPIYEIPPAARDSGMTLVALHGHGSEPFTGIYDYVPGMARRGYRIVMPILFGVMERETKGMRPDWKNMCREWEIEAHALGTTLLGARLHDAHLAYALARTLDGVDPERIGCIGLSMGGELTLYLAATEAGIKACVSAGFLSTFPSFMLKMRGCQCYSIRDWPRYFDMPDIAACAAPRPLQIQKGIDDPCFDHEDVGVAFSQLRDVYRRFGAEAKVDYQVYPGGHCLNQELADAWFQRNMRKKAPA